MNRLLTWVRERAHRTCTDLITAQHDAVVAGAHAHHDTRQELAAERAETARLAAHTHTLAADGRRLGEELSSAARRIQCLEEDLAAAVRRADQAEAVRVQSLKALTQTLDLPRVEFGPPLNGGQVGAEVHCRMIWFALTHLARSQAQAGHTDSADFLFATAEVHRLRMDAALKVLGGDGWESDLQVRLEQLAAITPAQLEEATA